MSKRNVNARLRTMTNPKALEVEVSLFQRCSASTPRACKESFLRTFRLATTPHFLFSSADSYTCCCGFPTGTAWKSAGSPRPQVHPLRKRLASGYEAVKPTGECELRPRHLRLWTCERCRAGVRGRVDGIRGNPVVSSPRASVRLYALRQDCRRVERWMHFCGNAIPTPLLPGWRRWRRTHVVLQGSS